MCFFLLSIEPNSQQTTAHVAETTQIWQSLVCTTIQTAQLYNSSVTVSQGRAFVYTNFPHKTPAYLSF